MGNAVVRLVSYFAYYNTCFTFGFVLMALCILFIVVKVKASLCLDKVWLLHIDRECCADNTLTTKKQSSFRREKHFLTLQNSINVLSAVQSLGLKIV